MRPRTGTARSRRAVTPAAAALLVAALAGAAPARAYEWAAGYTLGISNSSFTGTLGDSIPQSQYGFGFGVFIAWELTPHLRVMPELLLTSRGGTFKSPLFLVAFGNDSTVSDTVYRAGDVRRTLDLTYLELPVIASWSFARPQAGFNPHLQVGIAPALRILGRFRSGTEPGLGPPPAEPDDARRFDVSWIAGAGFRLRTRRAAMRFDLRLNQGLLEVFDRGDAPPGHNRAFSLVFAITP